MDNEQHDNPDPGKVLDMLKRHAAAYNWGCWDHHDGEIFNQCPYFASDHCVQYGSADAVALVKILLSHQSETSPYYQYKIPSQI